jgi:hypothetical protein
MHLFKSSLYYLNYNKIFIVSKKKTRFIGEGQCFEWKNLNSNIFLNSHLLALMKTMCAFHSKKKMIVKKFINMFINAIFVKDLEIILIFYYLSLTTNLHEKWKHKYWTIKLPC